VKGLLDANGFDATISGRYEKDYDRRVFFHYREDYLIQLFGCGKVSNAYKRSPAKSDWPGF
jgi:hypothetical protein